MHIKEFIKRNSEVQYHFTLTWEDAVSMTVLIFYLFILFFLVNIALNTSIAVVSVRLVEAENLEGRLFRVSDQRLIKGFGKFLRYIRARFAFKLGYAKFPPRIICLDTTLY